MESDRNLFPQPITGARNLTRRSVLQRAGWIAAGFALPTVPQIGSTDQGISPITLKLSTYMGEAANVPLPVEVLEKTKQHLLDTFAAMISGSQLAPGRAAINFARNYGGEKVATVVCSDRLCGPIEAALANGVLAHSDETDDAHGASGSHPGASVIPAALAAGEQFTIDGARFLRAVALGYDIGPRVVAAMGGAALQSEAHRSTHSIGGIFGAAAAAACAMHLNAQQMRWLLDYTAQQCSGIAAWQRDTQHIEKGFVYGGMPARGGVTSALLVQSGWTGVDDVFSGADNLLQAEALRATPESLVDGLGGRYEVTQTDIKKWTVGAPIQAPLDALENLLKRQPINPDRVRQFTVRIAASAAKVVDNREMPDICLQHLSAVMLLDKTVSFRAAHDTARMKDPQVLKLRMKVELIGDAELEKAMPRREAIVAIVLDDGTKLSEHVTAVRGSAANPMSREEVTAKARDLIAPVLGASTAGSLTEKILALENIKDIHELRPLLQKS